MSIHDDVTAKILAVLDDAGKWRPCWHRPGGTSMQNPANAITDIRYKGVNILLLWAESQVQGYTSHRWATYKTWGDKGAQVRKGEKSTAITFWTRLEKGASDEGEAGATRGGMVCKRFNVFNALQVDGDPTPAVIQPFDPLAQTERRAALDLYLGELIAGGMNLAHDASFQPCYRPAIDQVQLPPFDMFKTAEGYYATAFHEAGHWTGHKSRLDRFSLAPGDIKARAFEELIAELTACFLAAQFGLPVDARDDHAAYIGHWLAVMKEDSRAIGRAAGAAERAVAHIDGIVQDRLTAASLALAA